MMSYTQTSQGAEGVDNSGGCVFLICLLSAEIRIPKSTATDTGLSTTDIPVPTSFRACLAASWTLGCGSESTSDSLGTTEGRAVPSCLGAQ